MHYRLKDYQRDAADATLTQLARIREDYAASREDAQPRYGYVSLSAPTGSGKTVIAAAVLEELIFGTEDHPADPTATVIWFSDDPALNRQSRARIESASDRLRGRTTIIETDFVAEKLDRGRVYFLNAQKLGKNSTLVRGADLSGDAPRPDTSQRSFYDVLRDTLTDPERTVYLVLDEAHRGMRGKDRSTIVQRLIAGQGDVPPIPAVLGVSATVELFDTAMTRATSLHERKLPVQVDVDAVQASGLLKDTIALSVPTEKGAFDLLLLAQATQQVVAQSRRWAEYHAEHPDTEKVLPLLLVQVPDSVSPARLSEYLDVIYDNWTDLRSDAAAHVFGEHTDLELGGRTVPYIEPQRVQSTTEVRVLLAKTAVTTGWDCPRAEVMISLRPAKDRTHITQTLGRIMRTPLARRIDGDEMLNSATCILPRFDTATVTEVVAALTRDEGTDHSRTEDGTGGGAGRKVVVNPVEVEVNPEIGEEVWDAFDRIESAALPSTTSNAAKRLSATVTELALDIPRVTGERGTVMRDTRMNLGRALDGLLARYADKIADARHDVLTMSAVQVFVDTATGEERSEEYQTPADRKAVARSYSNAVRILGKSVTQDYLAYYLLSQSETLAELRADDPDELAEEVEIILASASLVPEVVEGLTEEMDRLREGLLTEYRPVRISGGAEREKAYQPLLGRPGEPVPATLTRPTGGMVRPLDTTYRKHLLSDANGDYPAALNRWERGVLDAVAAKPGYLGWYRNPSTSSTDSLAIPYVTDSGENALLRPDFITFHRSGDEVVADIIDPHGDHLADALPKLRGLARYAESGPPAPVRMVEAVSMVDGVLRALPLNDADVRTAVLAEGASAPALYREHGVAL